MVTYAMSSNIGSRKVNEDRIGMEKLGNEYGFFLADGLGGHGRGDAASGIAVEEARAQFFREGAAWHCMDRIFNSAQDNILEYQRQTGSEGHVMTTLSALLISEVDIRWGHIGDSRIYYFFNRELVSVTKDQSVPQMLAASGKISPEEIRFHPDRNRLLQCMGIRWEGTPYEISESVPRAGDQAFLLCSDGFWEMILEKEMERLLLLAQDATEWLNDMMMLVERRGKDREKDNYSAITVWCQGGMS